MTNTLKCLTVFWGTVATLSIIVAIGNVSLSPTYDESIEWVSGIGFAVCCVAVAATGLCYGLWHAAREIELKERSRHRADAPDDGDGLRRMYRRQVTVMKGLP